MSNNQSENRTDGDNERDEEKEEDVSGEDEEEEAEDEPRLKYQRMGGSVPALLSGKSASCIEVAERMIALGTRAGSVHILDFLGNQVKEFLAHGATVNDLCFDIEGEYIASCSDDGSVAINSLYTDAKLKFDYHRPMKAIALDPYYARNSSKRFVVGGLAGHMYYNIKKWIGYRDQVLQSGEGPIHAVKWRTSLVAWANDGGVNVYDTSNDQRITYIERPRGSLRPTLLFPHLVWQDDSLLVIGWGTSVKIALIKSNQNSSTNKTYKHIQMSHMDQVDIVASFQTSYYISGIAPFGENLVVLAYIPEEDGNSYTGGQWAAGDEPFYYIVSPKDVIIAKPRDAEDHISWLLQHGWHGKALEAVEAGKGSIQLLDKVGSKYLDHLIGRRNYAKAASLCPKLLQGSASAWERWVFHFAHLQQLSLLVPYMPTENPRLRNTAYEVALVALVTNPSFHKELLSTVKAWPPLIYSAVPVISAIEPHLNTSYMTDALKEALAEIYVINAQYEEAFSLYADLLKPDLFEFIEKHNLHDSIREKVVQLMKIDSKRAVTLLIQHMEMISPNEVVSQLLATEDDSRYFLYQYLHSLFEDDPHAGRDFHDMQRNQPVLTSPGAFLTNYVRFGLMVELYADHDPKVLLRFLRNCQHYKLMKAYEICVSRGLLREQVYILKRMGNSKQALVVIINELGDIEQAIEFVSMQHDDELWVELIRQCIQNPEMVGVLLEHTDGNLDPLYIVNIIPNGLEIPRLRDRLIKIIKDYRTETSLRRGCNNILKGDIINLLIKYYEDARRAIYMSNEEDEVRSTRDDDTASNLMERSRNMKTMDIKSKTRAGGRTCLLDSANTVDEKKTPAPTSHEDAWYYEYEKSDPDNVDDNNINTLGSPQMRCILCTTATSTSH
uniref:Vacuolar protein sorting-associated protein 41 homolog n=1 Tax=Daucus carota subsp. sativus TaxID=79200 RepID=A0A162A733_DAUCS